MKPILFNTDMVRATLEDRKTETRRLVKPIPPENARLDLVGDRRNAMDLSIEIPGPNDRRIYTPPYLLGDILYVRETWGDYREFSEDKDGYFYLYRADYPDGAKTVPFPENEKLDYAESWDLPKWHPSIHMPKEAARIFLRVTDLRVERLQEITEIEARSEGAEMIQIARELWSYRKGFEKIWNSTLKHMNHIRYGWAANPWVWVISFKRCEKPEEG